MAQRANASGVSLSADQYDAFGARQSTATSTDVFGFSGQWGGYTDTETGLVLMTHRYYDPSGGTLTVNVTQGSLAVMLDCPVAF